MKKNFVFQMQLSLLFALILIFFQFLQEYDYVFDVDIQEGKPTLKLPFNITGKTFKIVFLK